MPIARMSLEVNFPTESPENNSAWLTPGFWFCDSLGREPSHPVLDFKPTQLSVSE